LNGIFDDARNSTFLALVAHDVFERDTERYGSSGEREGDTFLVFKVLSVELFEIARQTMYK
jgi:hypothetical protein